ncbi:RDD family protein [Sessilibacter sp. MAH4]
MYLSELPNAPLWRKFTALIYDWLVLAAVCMGYGALVLFIQVNAFGKTFGEGEKGDFGTLGFLGLVLLIFAFYCFFWRRGGQTLGMRAWRLQIIANDGKKPSFLSCVIRGIIAPIGLGVFLLGYLWQLIDKDNQTLHDKLSRTRIVLLPKDKK